MKDKKFIRSVIGILMAGIAPADKTIIRGRGLNADDLEENEQL